MLVAGILSATHLGKSTITGLKQKRANNCPSASERCEQSWAPGLQETCQLLGFSLPPTKEVFCHSQGLYIHESPLCLAILCRVTSPVTWCLASRGGQCSCCPGTEIPGRFFMEVGEEKTWQQNPEYSWDWITGTNHTNPPSHPREM